MGAPQYEQAGADVSGSGTPGTIPVWSSGTTLGDSPLTVSGTTVTATQAFTVNGTQTFNGNLVSGFNQTWALNGGFLNIQSGLLYLDKTNSRIGIGTASPQAQLEVKKQASGYALRLQNAVTVGFSDVLFAFNAANTATSTQDAYLDLITSGGGPYEFMIGSAASIPFTMRTAGQERVRITTTGNVHAASGTTTMTDGFFYIPAAAGAPTGTPTAISGRVPMYYDTTNNEFYVYNTAWKKVALL